METLFFWFDAKPSGFSSVTLVGKLQSGASVQCLVERVDRVFYKEVDGSDGEERLVYDESGCTRLVRVKFSTRPSGAGWRALQQTAWEAALAHAPLRGPSWLVIRNAETRNGLLHVASLAQIGAASVSLADPVGWRILALGDDGSPSASMRLVAPSLWIDDASSAAASGPPDLIITVGDATAPAKTSALVVSASDLASAHLPRLHASIDTPAAALQLAKSTNALAIAIELARITASPLSLALPPQRFMAMHELLMMRRHAENGFLYRVDGGGSGSHVAAESYEGGLVLDARPGIYGSTSESPSAMVLHVDVRSLYPSVCVEHALCYAMSGCGAGQLVPPLLRYLVETRDAVRAKDAIKAEALKLAANSFYGCIGSPRFRFYSRRLAAEITRRGRETLRQLCDDASSHRLVAGDTDALMIECENRERAANLGASLVSATAARYSFVRLKVEAVYRLLVLCSRKTHIAVRDGSSNASTEIIDKSGAVRVGDAPAVAALTQRCIAAAARRDVDAMRDLRASVNVQMALARAFVESGVAAFTCSSRLGKPLSAYAASDQSPQIVVARQCKSAAFERAGSLVPYVLVVVVVRGSNESLYTAIHPRDFVDQKIDYAAYARRFVSATAPLAAALGLSAESGTDAVEVLRARRAMNGAMNGAKHADEPAVEKPPRRGATEQRPLDVPRALGAFSVFDGASDEEIALWRGECMLSF